MKVNLLLPHVLCVCTFPKSFSPQFDWASLASVSQTRQSSVRSLPEVCKGCRLDSDLQLKHERIISLICTVNLTADALLKHRVPRGGWWGEGGAALFSCFSCKLELLIAVYLKRRACDPDDRHCVACQAVLMCHGRSRLRFDRLKLRDRRRAMELSVMTCSGNEMTQMRNSLWFCKLGFCKWPISGVSKLLLFYSNSLCFSLNPSEGKSWSMVSAGSFWGENIHFCWH